MLPMAHLYREGFALEDLSAATGSLKGENNAMKEAITEPPAIVPNPARSLSALTPMSVQTIPTAKRRDVSTLTILFRNLATQDQRALQGWELAVQEHRYAPMAR